MPLPRYKQEEAAMSARHLANSLAGSCSPLSITLNGHYSTKALYLSLSLSQIVFGISFRKSSSFNANNAASSTANLPTFSLCVRFQLLTNHPDPLDLLSISCLTNWINNHNNQT